MGRSALPRLARLLSVRDNGAAVTLIGTVYDGPDAERGRYVHIPLTVRDLPVLRKAVAILETGSSDG